MPSKTTILFPALVSCIYCLAISLGQSILVVVIAHMMATAIISTFPLYVYPLHQLFIFLTLSAGILSVGAQRAFEWIFPKFAKFFDEIDEMLETLADVPSPPPSEKEGDTLKEAKKQSHLQWRTLLCLIFFVLSMIAMFGTVQSHRNTLSQSSELVRFNFDVVFSYEDPDQKMHLGVGDIGIIRCGSRDWTKTEPLLSEDVKLIIRRRLQKEPEYKDANIVFVNAYRTTPEERVESCNDSK